MANSRIPLILEPDTPGAFATNMDAKSASNSVSTAEDICVCVCVVGCVFCVRVKSSGQNTVLQ